MHLLLIAILAFQAATVVDVDTNSQVTLGGANGRCEQPSFPHELKPDSMPEGEHVRAEVKHGMLTVQLKNGKKATARVIRIQRILSHPLPD